MRASRTAFLAAAAVALSLPVAFAAEPEKGTFSLLLENDIVSGFDRDYTNGIQLSWTSGPDDVPAWALATARILPVFPENGRVRASYAVGQSIYTPNDITLENPPLNDRPYAGWLYGSIGLISETGTQLDQLRLQLGVVGPASLAHQTQTFVHQIIGADIPRGWDTQLNDEPGVVLTYQRSWRAFAAGTLAGFAVDVTPHLGGAVGNVFTYANGGATLRLGWKLPNDYGPPRIQPSLPGSGFFVPQDSFGWYLFAGLEGRLVARNIFLDGNTFEDSRHVHKEPLVGDVQVGIAVTFRSTRVAYTHVFRSREFEGQHDADTFGALSVSVRF